MKTARLIRFASLSLLLFAAGCAKEAPPPEPAAPPPPPEPVIKTLTSGTVDLSALPVDNIKLVEVIVIEESTPELDKLLGEQHQLFTAMIAPAEAEDATPTGGIELLSERDLTKLNEQIEKLKSEFPPPLVSSYTVSGTSREFTSRDSLVQRYREPIDSITLANMVPVLNGITEKLRGDYETLQREEENYAESRRGYQAMADINWMAGFTDYMKDYGRVVRRYDSLRRRAMLRAARDAKRQGAAATPAGAFEQFQAEHAMNLQASLYKAALGTAFVNEDGTFEVEGSGEIFVRIDDENRRPVFFTAEMTPPTARVEITDIRKETTVPTAE